MLLKILKEIFIEAFKSEKKATFKINKDFILKSFIKEEGLRLKDYKCTEGYLTGGIGHAYTKTEIKNKYTISTKEMAFNQFWKDIDSSVRYCRKKFGTDFDLNNLKPFELALLHMRFQLGGAGLNKFKKTIQYIEYNKFFEASQEALDSRWAKQTPNRASAITYMLSCGVNLKEFGNSKVAKTYLNEKF